MAEPIQEQQYTFLKTLCDLYDGDNFVPESKIREAWPDCPSHTAILNMGVDLYFDRYPDFRVQSYMPTAAGISMVREREQFQMLQQLRQDFDQYRSDETAYKASQELNAKKTEKMSFWKNIISSVAAGIISGLAVSHWPCIVVWIHSIAQ